MKHSEIYSAWIQAICRKDIKKFTEFLQQISQKDLNDVCEDAIDSKGYSLYVERTPLMLACQLGFLDGVKKLLGYPLVDYKTKNKHGISPFDIAVASQNDELIDYFFDEFELTLEDRQAALIHYAKSNNLEKVNVCLTTPGIDVNHMYCGNTALTAALLANGNDVAQFLLTRDGIDPNVPDADGNPPIVVAMLRRKDAIVKTLGQRCDFTIQSFSYGTAITAGILLDYDQLAMSLLDKCKKQDLALHPLILQCAVLKEKTSIIFKLIEMGIDVNDMNDSHYQEPFEHYWTDRQLLDVPFCTLGSPQASLFELPLVIAVRENLVSIAKMLLDAEADPQKRGVLSSAIELSEFKSETMRDIFQGYRSASIPSN